MPRIRYIKKLDDLLVGFATAGKLNKANINGTTVYYVPGEKRITRAATTCHFDFESVYNIYPRKLGKAQAFKVLQDTIKTEDDYNLLEKAVQNYANKCKADRTEEKYIKHFSSFIGTRSIQKWRDWLNTTPKQTLSLEGLCYTDSTM